MPYIAYDLDALDAAPHVARASGISDDAAVAGNARLWAWCWKAKTDVVTAAHLAGFYGSEKVAEAMVAFGFLESVPDGFRVKGAERYLRIDEARSRGGHAAKGNLIPGAKYRKVLSAEHELSREPADSQPIDPIGSLSALSSSIEHRTSKRSTGSKSPATVLSDAMVNDFTAARGERYLFSGSKDGPALAELRKTASDEEILKRWSLGLRSGGWNCISTIAQLRSKWNDLTAVTATGSAKPPIQVDPPCRPLGAKR